jgi:C1A family cysteine protease
MTQSLGWIRPGRGQVARLKFSAPSTGVLDGIIPAETSDNYDLCRVLDQGPRGSCVAQATAQVIRAAQVKQWGQDAPLPSRAALWWWSRYQDGWQLQDSGTYICTCFDMAAQMGLPPETAWPYTIDGYATKPPPGVCRAGFDERGTHGYTYEEIAGTDAQRIDLFERALTAGYLVAFGVDVTEEFCSTLPHDVVQPPKAGETIAGGHAMTVIGHDRANQRFLVLNSWGPYWGDPSLPPGCFWMSCDYLAQADDCWFVPHAPLPEVIR